MLRGKSAIMMLAPALLLLTLIAPSLNAQSCQVFTPTHLTLAIEPQATPQIVRAKVILYNESTDANGKISRTFVPDARILLIQDENDTTLCYMATDANGEAESTDIPLSRTCVQMRAVYCPAADAENQSLCLRLKLTAPVSRRCDSGGGTPNDNPSFQASQDTNQYCNYSKGTVDVAFCTIVGLLFGLLFAAAMVQGRNPLYFFDFGSARGLRVSRGAGYTPMAQNVSVNVGVISKLVGGAVSGAVNSFISKKADEESGDAKSGGDPKAEPKTPQGAEPAAARPHVTQERGSSEVAIGNKLTGFAKSNLGGPWAALESLGLRNIADGGGGVVNKAGLVAEKNVKKAAAGAVDSVGGENASKTAVGGALTNLVARATGALAGSLILGGVLGGGKMNWKAVGNEMLRSSVGELLAMAKSYINKKAAEAEAEKAKKGREGELGDAKDKNGNKVDLAALTAINRINTERRQLADEYANAPDKRKLEIKNRLGELDKKESELGKSAMPGFANALAFGGKLTIDDGKGYKREITVVSVVKAYDKDGKEIDLNKPGGIERAATIVVIGKVGSGKDAEKHDYAIKWDGKTGGFRVQEDYVQTLNATVNGDFKDLRTAHDEINALKDRVKDLKKEIDRKKSGISDVDKEIGDAEGKIKDIGGKKQKLEALQQEQKGLAGKKNPTEAEKNRLEALGKEVRAAESALSALVNPDGSKKGDILGIANAHIASLDSQNKAGESKIAQLNADIAKLGQDLEDIEKTLVPELEKKSDRLAGQIAVVQAEKDRAAQALASACGATMSPTASGYDLGLMAGLPQEAVDKIRKAHEAYQQEMNPENENGAYAKKMNADGTVLAANNVVAQAGRNVAFAESTAANPGIGREAGEYLELQGKPNRTPQEQERFAVLEKRLAQPGAGAAELDARITAIDKRIELMGDMGRIAEKADGGGWLSPDEQAKYDQYKQLKQFRDDYDTARGKIAETMSDQNLDPGQKSAQAAQVAADVLGGPHVQQENAMAGQKEALAGQEQANTAIKDCENALQKLTAGYGVPQLGTPAGNQLVSQIATLGKEERQEALKAIQDVAGRELSSGNLFELNHDEMWKIDGGRHVFSASQFTEERMFAEFRHVETRPNLDRVSNDKINENGLVFVQGDGSTINITNVSGEGNSRTLTDGNGDSYTMTNYPLKAVVGDKENEQEIPITAVKETPSGLFAKGTDNIDYSLSELPHEHSGYDSPGTVSGFTLIKNTGEGKTIEIASAGSRSYENEPGAAALDSQAWKTSATGNKIFGALESAFDQYMDWKMRGGLMNNPLQYSSGEWKKIFGVVGTGGAIGDAVAFAQMGAMHDFMQGFGSGSKTREAGEAYRQLMLREQMLRQKIQ